MYKLDSKIRELEEDVITAHEASDDAFSNETVIPVICVLTSLDDVVFLCWCTE
jgi:hypothetical protein